MFTKTALTNETYPVVLDPTVSLTDQIKSGNYGYVNDLYTPENFKLTLTGEREVILYDPKGFVSSKIMIARMKADGCVPATLDDCLAFGAAFPDRQKKNRIVFLGTVWTDRDRGQRVPVLDSWNGERELLLSWFGFDWDGYFCFAAVRES